MLSNNRITHMELHRDTIANRNAKRGRRANPITADDRQPIALGVDPTRGVVSLPQATRHNVCWRNQRRRRSTEAMHKNHTHLVSARGSTCAARFAHLLCSFDGRLLTSLVVVTLLGLFGHGAISVRAGSQTLVISEFRTRGPNGASDEFIELLNISASAVDIGGWKVNGSNNVGGTSTRATILAGTTLSAGYHKFIPSFRSNLSTV